MTETEKKGTTADLLLRRLDTELQMRDELRRNYRKMSRRLDLRVVCAAVAVAALCVAVALALPRPKYTTDAPSKGQQSEIVSRTYNMMEQL
ncbi:MAG: hypothetical protein IKP21_05490 [Bacteroidales bacterium]|nr:hypothetical protein [Bacteroidales bacterium]